MKTGIIDVGGGMRGVYTAGIYDFLMDEGIEADCCIGVSAGSANMISYLSAQRGRARRFYIDYAMRSEYISFKNLVTMGSYINLDYAYSVLSNSGGEDPLDYEAFFEKKDALTVVAMDALEGLPHYFAGGDIKKDCYDVLKASCALPVASQPYWIGGRAYFDGGIADPVPYKKALEYGCEKIIVLLTRPRDFVRPAQKHMALAKIAMRRYPKALSALARRHEVYNRAVAEVAEMEKEGRAVIVAPESIAGMGTLTRKKSALEALYSAGYADAKKIADYISK